MVGFDVINTVCVSFDDGDPLYGIQDVQVLSLILVLDPWDWFQFSLVPIVLEPELQIWHVGTTQGQFFLPGVPP